jgi:hypothetical protein
MKRIKFITTNTYNSESLQNVPKIIANIIVSIIEKHENVIDRSGNYDIKTMQKTTTRVLFDLTDDDINFLKDMELLYNGYKIEIIN